MINSKYKIGSIVKVIRPRALPYTGRVTNVTSKTLILDQIRGLRKEYAKARIALEAIKRGKVIVTSVGKQAKAAKAKKPVREDKIKVFVAQRGGYGYATFPKNVVPEGFTYEKKGKRVDDDQYEWRHFYHGKKKYLGRFVARN